MTTYKRKPIKVEAIQLTDETFVECYEGWIGTGNILDILWLDDAGYTGRYIRFKSAHGHFIIEEEGYLIEDEIGLYVCDPDTFKEQYEVVDYE